MSAVLEVREPSARYLTSPHTPVEQHFDLLVSAPRGAVQLRALLLTLAIHGKLVRQDPKDAPAQTLFQAIATEKARVHAERSRAAEVLAGPVDGEGPYDIPATWAWVPLGDVVDIVRGITFPASEKTKEAAAGRIACLRTANVQEAIEWDDLLFVDRSFMGREEQLLQVHDIVMSMANSRELVGKVALVEQIPHREATFGGFLGVLRPWKVEPRYVMAFLRSAHARSTLIDSASQTTNIANISLGKLRPLLFPLPPLAEQARIVARVDELMCLCDALEEKGRLEAEQHARLLSTLLGTLTDSATPEELAANWQRVAEHFDLLLDRPEAVDAMEQVITQLAVRGLLVPQQPSEAPATMLVHEIEAAKRPIGAAAKGRNGTDSSLPLDDDKAPFVAPEKWAWCRLGEVAAITGGITLGRKGTPAKPVTLPYLRVANVQRGRLDLQSMKEIVIDHAELPRFQLVDGDLLITEGGDWDKVGRTAIWRSELPECAHQNHVFKARGYTSSWSPEWAELYLNSPDARAYFASSAKQTTNLASINMTQLKSCAFPLPPTEEQRRIIARVSALRRLCGDLRHRLQAQQTTQSRLAQALVEQATA